MADNTYLVEGLTGAVRAHPGAPELIDIGFQVGDQFFAIIAGAKPGKFNKVLAAHAAAQAAAPPAPAPAQ